MHILVTGATGMIGKALVQKLLLKKFKITVVGRYKNKLVNIYGSKTNHITWDEFDKIKDMPDIIIHLAGHNIGNSIWTQKNKKKAFDSRIKTAEILTKWCKKKQISPRVIHASGVTYYGFYNDCNTICDENSLARIKYKQFTQELAIATENSFPSLPKTSLRFGVVLCRNHGIMPKLAIPTKLGAGTVFGTGIQPIPWVALEDATEAIVFLIEKQIQGPVNITSPEIISQHEFIAELAKKFRRPLFIKAPESLLRIIAGEFAEQFLISGQAVAPKKLLKYGYSFKYTKLKDWLCENYI